MNYQHALDQTWSTCHVRNHYYPWAFLATSLHQFARRANNEEFRFLAEIARIRSDMARSERMGLDSRAVTRGAVSSLQGAAS